jgi:hypothetical protein
VGGDSLDIFGGVTIWLVPRTAGFEVVKDFFGEVLADARFVRHCETDLRLMCGGTMCTALLTLGKQEDMNKLLF